MIRYVAAGTHIRLAVVLAAYPGPGKAGDGKPMQANGCTAY
jgi:hypothetical protein